MNLALATQPRLQLPTEATAMMQLATQLSASRTIPSVFQKSPADCFNVLSICMRFGFDFYSTIWECSSIKGRLFYSGKMVHAMLNASGHLAERLNFDYTPGPIKDGVEDIDGRKVTVRGRIQGETGMRIVDVFVADVATDNEHWKKNPDQMLSYSGARIWARRHLPEVLLGLMFDDEAPEWEASLKDVTPKDEPERTVSGRLKERSGDHYIATGPKEPDKNPPTDKEIETAAMAKRPAIATPQEVQPEEPRVVELPDDDQPLGANVWRLWCEQFIKLMRVSSNSFADVQRWCKLNAAALDRLQMERPDTRRNLENAIEQQRLRFPQTEDAR